MSIELLILAFDKAEEEVGSSKKTQRAQYLSDLLQENYKYSISERTLRDYYTNYKNGNIGAQDDLKPKLITCFCDYLGYKNYADFINQNQDGRPENSEEEGRLGRIKEKEEEKRKLKGERKKSRRIFIISISISFGAVLFTVLTLNYPILFNSQPSECMTWADSIYVKVSCKRGPFSQYGTKVEPLIETKLKNMRKVSVDAAYQFFSEDGKPLIWYFKNEDNEHEFFTSPGLHPVTGETLRKITPYIIQTYVPLHKYKKESFVQ